MRRKVGAILFSAILIILTLAGVTAWKTLGSTTQSIQAASDLPFLSPKYWREQVLSNTTSLIKFRNLEVRNITFFVKVNARCEYFHGEQRYGYSRLEIHKGWVEFGNYTWSVDFLNVTGILKGDVIHVTIQAANLRLPDGTFIKNLNMSMEILKEAVNQAESEEAAE